MGGQAPQTLRPGEVWPPSGWSPVARMSGRRPGRSLPCPARPVRGGDVRPAGRADVQRPHVRCPGVRCIQVSGRTGLRCPRRRRRAVRAALDPGVARCGGPPRPGAAGRRAAVGHGRRGCLPASGRTGRDGSALAVPGSHEIDRSQGAAWPASGCGAALAPAADMGAGPGPGCRPGSREHGWSRCSPAPAGVLGRSLAWCRQWPGPGGDDHAGWSLGEDGPVASSSGGPTRFGGGAACGRGAAAGREERCPLGAYRSFTSENSGGRDRV